MWIFNYLFCSLFTCQTECPVCPVILTPCHQPIHIKGECPCTFCLTKCPGRKSFCKKGEMCKYKAVHVGDEYIGVTATCPKFVRCHGELWCMVGCPRSGHIYDKNDCRTCHCKNPCEEIKCPGKCSAYSSDPGSEARYKCLA